jgi:cyclase
MREIEVEAKMAKIIGMPFRRRIFATGILLACSLTAHAQGGAPDFSKVEIVTTKISNSLYTLDGNGGRIGVLVGPDGIFMVDDEFAPLSDKILAAIRKISSAPIRFLVNTHVHPDHTGGNENFAKLGAVLFSRDELRWRLAHPAPAANGAPGTPARAAALPIVTYEGPVTFHFDGDEVKLVPILRAHTDGDTMVLFPASDAIMTGDSFRSLGYPNIDRGNGGSLPGMLDGLAQVIGIAGPNTKIIPGHGAIVDRAAVIAHRDMILAIRDRVADLIKQGKSQQDVIAAHPTADYDAKVPQGAMTSVRFIGQLYAELSGAK